MSENRSGCFSCLGSLFSLAFALGSLIFLITIFVDGGILVRIAGFQLSLNKPIDRKQIVADYWTDLENKQKVAAEAVQKFHTQQDQGKCQEIYEQSSELFKRGISQAEMLNLCAEIERNLGTVKSAQQSDWWGQTADKNSEQYILVRYNTKFSKSSVHEIFTWLVKDNKPELVGYQIF